MAPGTGDDELSIIAMKGYPFTRKTEFAETIAASLGCPMLSSEDVLKCLTPPLSPERESEAFRVVCEIALSHLRKKISKNVVIDSSLSSQSHLNHLIDLVSRLYKIRVRVIIIECKPMNNHSWKMKFDSRRTPHEEWYKAKNWEDVEKAIQDNPDYDLATSIVGDEFVSKLVVDPLVDCQLQSTKSIIKTAPRVYKNPDLVRAVQYMKARDKGDGPDVVIYRQWLQQSQYQSSSISPLDKNHCSSHGHHIVPNSGVVEHEVADCMACRKQISRSEHGVDEYCYCKNCNLALHMECAKAFNDDHEGRKHGYKFNKVIPLPSKQSHRMFPCNPCRESGKPLSYKCKTCLFQEHIRSGLYPTVIEHFDKEKHFLTIWFVHIGFFSRTSYPCVACGETNATCMYLCNEHGVAYCYECVTLPRRVEDEHGGHHHTLSLKFTSEEAEDYICIECLELRDPTLWFYSCEDCPGYQVHPCCVDKIRQLHPTFQLRQERNFRKH